MRWVGHVECMGEKGMPVLVRKPEGMRTLGRPGIIIRLTLKK
jgi:hypothetical protein